MATKQHKVQYENNPFLIAGNGITLFFTLAKGVGIVFIILSIVGLFANAPSPVNSESSARDITAIFQNWELSEWLLFGGAVSIIGLALVMITSLFSGVGAYTSARLSQGDRVVIREAFSEAFDKLWSYIWLQIITVVKILLWSLLFIVPGIIMAVRYSMANVVFFDDTKNLRGNDAIKESIRLTRGAWITTYAATALFNMLTLGAISGVVSVGANAILYRQYQQAGDKKPAAHWLSWLALFLPFIILFLLIVFVVFTAIIFALLGIKTT